jgi:uncharacterized membrane protein
MHRLKSLLTRFIQAVRTGFWFIPGSVVMASIALAGLLLEVDNRVGFEALKSWPQLFGAGSDGSRSMLSAVATSMITVAGVTFSITILALAQTSAQYSPRLLRTFMADRSTQLVLGSFVGIFAYCLVVLRSITSSDSEVEFIPRIAVFTGGVLALISIGFLVYFIHHISLSLQPANILASVAYETMSAVDRLFPEPLGEGAADEEVPRLEEELAQMEWIAVAASQSGYVQSVNSPDLLVYAEAKEIVVRMEARVGEFLVEGSPLVSVAGASGSGAVDSMAEDLRSMLPVGMHRTIEQDAPYGMEQLADVAAKTLSPSVNDSRTAVTCIHYLTAILCRVAERRIETPYRFGRDKKVRVVAVGPSFDSMLMTAFDPVLRNVRDRAEVFDSLLEAIATLGSRMASAERNAILANWVERIRASVRRKVRDARNRDDLLQRVDQVREELRRK